MICGFVQLFLHLHQSSRSCHSYALPTPHMLIFSSLWLQPLHSSGFFDAAPTICEVSTYCCILLRWCMLATTHNSDDYDDTIINWNLKKLANFDTPRTNFEKFPNKFTFCSEQILTFFSFFDTSLNQLREEFGQLLKQHQISGRLRKINIPMHRLTLP